MGMLLNIIDYRCFGQAVPAMQQFVPLILRSWM